MTYREALAWNKRKATFITVVGFALFVGGVWLAHQNVVPLAPQVVMLTGAILFVISVHYVRLFAFRCIHCGAAWDSLATNQGLGIAKHIRYCPSCGCDIGAEMDQAQEAGAASQEPFFQLRQQQLSAMVAVSSPEDLTTGKSDVGRLWPVLGRLKGLELVLFCLAVIGLILSLVVHLCGSLGLPQPFGDTTWFLHVGIVVVWVPAIAV
jgi:hypothetical protein